MEQSIGTHASWNDTFVRFIKNFKDKSQVLKYQKSLSKMVYHNSKSLIESRLEAPVSVTLHSCSPN